MPYPPRYPGAASFVEAAHYSRSPGSNGTVTRIVVHDMEMPEKGTTAETCARYFATTTRDASAHYCIDSDSVVQCVDHQFRAYHAPPNTGSIGLEHAGFASQSRAQWLDPFGVAMIEQSARLAAWLCREFELPPRWLSIAQLRGGERGICTHYDVSRAFGQSSHTDPGPGFPKDYYLDRVINYYEGDGADMALTDDDIARLTGSAAFTNAVRAAVWKAGWGTSVPGETELAEIRLYRASHPEHAANTIADAVAARFEFDEDEQTGEPIPVGVTLDDIRRVVREEIRAAFGDGAGAPSAAE